MASEKERARIMEKARREKYLSPADRAKLTPGQVAKLKSQGHLNDNPTGLRTPESAVGVQNINGQWTVTSVNGKPSFGNPGNLPSPGGSDGGGGGGGIPAFTTGYTPDSIYNDALAQIAARRQQSLNAATEGERALSNDYGLGINQDGSGATYTGQWAASDQNQLGIDPSNPFSRASLLNKSYFVAGKVGEGSYANRGLLTSGAYQRSQGREQQLELATAGAAGQQLGHGGLGPAAAGQNGRKLGMLAIGHLGQRMRKAVTTPDGGVLEYLGQGCLHDALR